MGTGFKSIRKLNSKAYMQARINEKETHKERVSESFKIAKEELTDQASNFIAQDYKAINDAIDSLDTKDLLFPKKKYELQQLKKDVPKKYAISKGAVEELQEIINKILAQKRYISKQED
jgi:hypothetical protein